MEEAKGEDHPITPKDDEAVDQDVMLSMLLVEEKEELRKEAEKKRIDKQALKVVKQSDICLFCNLQDLFTKYEFEEMDHQIL